MLNKVITGSRILMGLIFFVFGLNGFLQFIPAPPPPEAAMNFMTALGGSGYFFPVLKMTEIVCGALLLSNFFSALAVVILAPVILQIFLFHAFLAPEGMGLALLLIVLEIILIYAYRKAYQPFLQAKVAPAHS